MTRRNDHTPVLVIGGGGSNGLGIARNLGRRGIPVYCVTSNSHELTCYSKYCAGYTILPDVEDDATTLKLYLQRFRHHVSQTAVLFPTTDTTLLTLAQFRDALTPLMAVIPPRPLVELMVLKNQFYASLRDHDIPHPRTLPPEAVCDPQVIQELTFPLFLRPVQSLAFYQHFKSKGFIAYSVADVHRFLHVATRVDLDLILQEVVPGPTTNGYMLRGYLDQHSRPRVLFLIQKIRAPSMFSVSCVNRSVPLAQMGSFLQVLLQYLVNLQYQGLFGAEFKRDPRDGQFKLLEINARSMGGNFMNATCGADDILAAYYDTLGEPISVTQGYHLGVYQINLMKDLPVLAKRLLHRRFSADAIRPYLGPITWARISRDDIRPFLHQLWTLHPQSYWRRIAGSRIPIKQSYTRIRHQ